MTWKSWREVRMGDANDQNGCHDQTSSQKQKLRMCQSGRSTSSHNARRPVEMNARRAVFVLLVVASMLVASGRDGAASEAVRLTVPYVRQTKILCGGAAAAMVFRYWGDAQADANQF